MRTRLTGEASAIGKISGHREWSTRTNSDEQALGGVVKLALPAGWVSGASTLQYKALLHREGYHPKLRRFWIPAFARMTRIDF